jgi:hypothetical protein
MFAPIRMKVITNREQQPTIMALLAGAVLIIGISTITYPTGSSGPLSAAYAAAQSTTTVEEIPVDWGFFVQCPAGDYGEEVHVTGKLHLLVHVTFDNTGGVHVKIQSNDQGVSGTGLTSGDIYHRTVTINGEFNIKVGQQATIVRNLNFIGQGNANDFLLHMLIHFTVNANGTVTAEVFDFNVECK